MFIQLFELLWAEERQTMRYHSRYIDVIYCLKLDHRVTRFPLLSLSKHRFTICQKQDSASTVSTQADEPQHQHSYEGPHMARNDEMDAQNIAICYFRSTKCLYTAS